MPMLGNRNAQKEAARIQPASGKVQLIVLLSYSWRVSCVKGIFLFCFVLMLMGESFLLKTVS